MRLLGLVKVVVSTFLTISAIGVLSVWLILPTASPSRLVAFIATMFAGTGAVISGVVWVTNIRRSTEEHSSPDAVGPKMPDEEPA